jgi:hypothetical protein
MRFQDVSWGCPCPAALSVRHGAQSMPHAVLDSAICPFLCDGLDRTRRVEIRRARSTDRRGTLLAKRPTPVDRTPRSWQEHLNNYQGAAVTTARARSAMGADLRSSMN